MADNHAYPPGTLIGTRFGLVEIRADGSRKPIPRKPVGRIFVCGECIPTEQFGSEFDWHQHIRRFHTTAHNEVKNQ